MKYLTITQVLQLYYLVIADSGGAHGLRDISALESCLAQPRMTFDGRDLYPSLNEKAAALCFSIVTNHPFVDGNKRVAHLSMECFLVLNGYELIADVDSQEQVFIGLASGRIGRDQLLAWLALNTKEIASK